MSPDPGAVPRPDPDPAVPDGSGGTNDPVSPTGPGRISRGGWLRVGAAAWAVLLLAGAAFSVRRDEPTVAEQRSLAQALPVVDRAIGDLVAAAGPETVVELTGRRIEEGCRVTPLRSGADLESTVRLRTAVADGGALLDRIAAGLPSTYRAGVRRAAGDAPPTLRADAGEFVAVRGAVPEPGVVEITLRTGCRPVPAGLDSGAAPLVGLSIDDEPVRTLAALGATAPSPVERVGSACAGGGGVWTARASATVPDTTVVGAEPLSRAAPPPAGAVVVSDLPELYAYRHGPLSLVVEALGAEVRVAATTVC